MMDGYDMGSGGWIVMVLFWAVVVAAIVWAVFVLPARRDAVQAGAGAVERPRDILDARLARGEIDTETYDQLRAKLAADGSA